LPVSSGTMRRVDAAANDVQAKRMNMDEASLEHDVRWCDLRAELRRRRVEVPPLCDVTMVDLDDVRRLDADGNGVDRIADILHASPKTIRTLLHDIHFLQQMDEAAPEALAGKAVAKKKPAKKAVAKEPRPAAKRPAKAAPASKKAKAAPALPEGWSAVDGVPQRERGAESPWRAVLAQVEAAGATCVRRDFADAREARKCNQGLCRVMDRDRWRVQQRGSSIYLTRLA